MRRNLTAPPKNFCGRVKVQLLFIVMVITNGYNVFFFFFFVQLGTVMTLSRLKCFTIMHLYQFLQMVWRTLNFQTFSSICSLGQNDLKIDSFVSTQVKISKQFLFSLFFWAGRGWKGHFLKRIIYTPPILLISNLHVDLNTRPLTLQSTLISSRLHK